MNESPIITTTNHQANVPENEVTSQIVTDVNASDPEKDILDYQITATTPVGAPFTIDTSSGKIYFYEKKNRETWKYVIFTILLLTHIIISYHSFRDSYTLIIILAY